MKTIHEFEPSDIKFGKDENDGQEPNPVHSFLMAQMFIIKLTGIPDDKPADAMFWLRKLIAEFLNAAQKAGIVVAVQEDVPAVFKESGRS